MAESIARLRELARHRAADRCEYCRLRQSADADQPFHLEHVIAQQHGGPTTMSNPAWACQPCNLHKGPNLSGIDPVSGAIVTLFNPRMDRWSEHFRQAADGTIEGLTPTGRATVAVLDVNGDGQPLLRQLNP